MALSKIDVANMLTGTIPQGNVARSSLPSGTILQIVRTYVANSSAVTTTSTSDAASGIQASITPTASGNLILVDYVSTMTDSGVDCHAKMYQKIGSASIAPMASANNFHVGYTDVTKTRYAPFTFSGSYTATSTDTLLYEPYIKVSSGTGFLVHANSSYGLTLTEVEQ